MNQWRKYSMFIALIGIAVIFTWLTHGVFLSPRNLSNLFLQTAGVGILAIGMTLIIVTRNIDLSVGSGIALCGATAAFLQVNWHCSAVMSILGGLGVGLLIGAWQGFWIAYQRVPSFIVTLAGMMIFRGLVLGITNGATIAPLVNDFKIIGQGYMDNHISIILGVVLAISVIAIIINQRRKRQQYNFSVQSWMIVLAKIFFIVLLIAGFWTMMLSNRGIPYAVLLMLAVALVFTFIATKTIFGRHLYALGGNPDAALLSGINIKNRVFVLYVIFGMLTALTGMVMTARLNAATTSAGQGLELDVIAACVIGGTSLMGGEGKIWGAILGALIMASLDNGMSLLDTNITYQYMIKGMILLLAVWFDMSTRVKR